MNVLKRYFPFARASFSVSLAYRTHIFLWIFSNFLEIGMMMFVWIAVFQYSNQSTLNGFTLTDIIFYNIFMTLSSSMVFMNPLWDVAEDYFDGKIAMSLIKPVRYEWMIFFQNLGANVFRNLMIAFPMILLILISPLFLAHGVSISWSQWLWYFLSIGLGLWINFQFNFLFASLIFKTEATFGLFQLNDIVLRIFSGALIPLSFFPLWTQALLTRTPFASIQFTPTMILLGRLVGEARVQALLLQGFWAISLGLLTHFVWDKTMKSMKVHGG